MKIHGFIHNYATPKGILVLKEQQGIIKEGGLYDRTEKIHLGLVGEPEQVDFFLDDPKVELLEATSDPKVYEYLTLRYIHNFCKENPDVLVWYIHSKTASHQKTYHSKHWKRKLMEYDLLWNHQRCVEMLQHYKVYGYIWEHLNFWWATGDYVSNLKRIGKGKHRFKSAVWISSVDPAYYRVNRKSISCKYIFDIELPCYKKLPKEFFDWLSERKETFEDWKAKQESIPML